MYGTACRSLLTTALVLVAACAGAASAAADGPPPPADLSASHFVCEPLKGGATRPGDDVVCRLTVDVLSGFGYDATADIAIPPNLDFDPAVARNDQGEPNPPGAPTSVHYGITQLGLLTAGQPKTVQIQFRIDPAATPGDVIRPVATIRVTNGPAVTVAAANAVVMPPPAVLSPSHMECTDVNGAPLRPADVLACVVQLANLPAKEDATEVSAVVPLPRTVSWSPGGNEAFHGVDHIVWMSNAFPGGVPSGPPDAAAPMRFDVFVGDVAPGTFIQPTARVDYVNALSRTGASAGIMGPLFVTAPAPAAITSMLACADADGLPLYPGDTISCAVDVAAAAQREGVGDLTALAAIPAATSAPGAALDATGANVVLAPQLGAVAPGAGRRATYQLRVDAGAAPGTTIAPVADVSGRSIGSDVPVSAHLAAAPLVVAARPVPAVVPATPATPGAVAAAATPGAAKPGATTPAKGTARICTSRRVVTVNVRPPRGRRWKSVTASFASKRIQARRVGRKGYFRARLVFQGLPKGALTVRLTGVTTRGQTVRRTRTYQLCATTRR